MKRIIKLMGIVFVVLSLVMVSCDGNVNSESEGTKNPDIPSESGKDVIVKNGVATVRDGITTLDYITLKDIIDNSTIEVLEIPASATINQDFSNLLSFLPNLREINVSSDNQTLKSVNGVLYSKEGKEIICYPVGKQDEVVDIPEGVEIIRKGAFFNARVKVSENSYRLKAYIKCINIPSSVISIETDFSRELEKIRTYNVDSLNALYKSIDGVLYSKDGSVLISYPRYKEGSTFTIPEDVKEIGKLAFYYADLKKVIVSEGVTSIGAECFSCISISTIFLPTTIQHIEKDAFKFLNKDLNLIIPLDEGSIDLSNLDLHDPDRLHIIWGSDSAFVDISQGTINGSEYTIPEEINGKKVTEIGADLEELKDKGIETINVPSGVTKLDSNMFCYLINLKNINVSPDNNSYKSVDGIVYSKDGKELEIYPSGREEKEFSIPEGVEKLGKDSLYVGRVKAGYNSYYTYSNLEVINIPSSVKEIINKFALNNLKEINVNSNNSVYKSIDGVLFTKDGTKLIKLPEEYDVEKYIIPEGVTTIGENAFKPRGSIKEVAIPNSVTVLEDYAFYNFSGISTIEIPSSITKIPRYCFGHCGGLKTVKFPSSITSIDLDVFYGSQDITDIYIDKEEGSITGAPWGAPETAVIHWKEN